MNKISNNNNNISVFSKLSNLVSGGFLNFARFINHLNCNIYCGHTFMGFQDFVKSYNNVYGWRTDSGQAATTLKHSIFMFIAFKHMHSSELFSYLQKSQHDFRFPEFVHCLFETIIVSVKSFSNNNSFVIGNLIMHNFKLDEVLSELLDKAEKEDFSYFMNIFGGTVLETIFCHDRIRPAFYKVLANDCVSFIDEIEKVGTCDSFDRNVISMLFIGRVFSNVEHSTAKDGVKRLNMTTQKYKQGSSQHLSIYRFANVNPTYADYEYQVNMKSLDGLSENMLKLFVCFLFIFRPQFSFSSSVIAGFEPFGFSGVESSIHWELYLSCERIRPTPRKIVSHQLAASPRNTSSDSETTEDLNIKFNSGSSIKLNRITSLLSELDCKVQPLIFILDG
jgi:hypothetical protein